MRWSDRDPTAAADLPAAIYRDKVLRARAQEPRHKLLAGFTLFRRGLELTKLDVARRLGPSEAESLSQALDQRFARVRRAREAGLYRPSTPVRTEGRT
jgi:hypothetical protein